MEIDINECFLPKFLFGPSVRRKRREKIGLKK